MSFSTEEEEIASIVDEDAKCIRAQRRIIGVLGILVGATLMIISAGIFLSWLFLGYFVGHDTWLSFPYQDPTASESIFKLLCVMLINSLGWVIAFAAVKYADFFY